MHWLNDHWMAPVGTAATTWVAAANMPSDLSGFEKLGALGLLGVFMWFTLTRLEKAIQQNSSAVERSTEATERLLETINKAK